METLPIKKVDAIKAFWQADAKGKSLLSNLFGEKVFSQKITDRIKTLEDACEAVGENYQEFLIQIKKLPVDEAGYKKVKVIAKALNEGWEPDWNNSNEYKYWPYFDMRSGFGLSYTCYGYWDTLTSVGSRLCFKSRELAEYAGKQFTEEYKSFLS